MKKVFDLNFCFKGSRKYVQGPDIFDAIVKLLSKEFANITKLKYTAYEMLYSNATLYITNKFVKKEYETINSIITFFSDDEKYYAVVCNNGKTITCSTDYSEEVVEKNSEIIENTISFQNTLPYSFTEIVVSMNKYFLNQTIDEQGKWIVTKFDYLHLDDISNINNATIKIELLQNLNNKLTKSKLLLNNKEVGYLYFSLIPKES